MLHTLTHYFHHTRCIRSLHNDGNKTKSAVFVTEVATDLLGKFQLAVLLFVLLVVVVVT